MFQLWYPAATRRDGPPRKAPRTRQPSRVKAAVYHSAEGYWPGLMSGLDGPKETSWHLSNPFDGPLVQHYPLNRVAWHAKGYNTPTIGVESEGKTKPITGRQGDNLRAFSAWLVQEGWLPRLVRPSSAVPYAQATLLEHNEVGRFLARPRYITECPSRRITWSAILEEAGTEEDETEDEMWKIIRADGARTAYALVGGGKWRLPNQAALNELRAKGIAEPRDKLIIMRRATVDAIPDV